jgi:thiol-disulfide isomerase/thioredoxin
LRLLLILLLALTAAPADAKKKATAADPATAPIGQLVDHPGRLRNAAQQALFRRDVPEATALMARVLAVEPADGFTHGLLAQTLAFGLNLGPEASAAWLSLADQAPDRPVLVAFAALAEREAHRNDRFLGPDSTWFAANLARIDAAQADASLPARYELLLARRSLLSLVKQHDAARDAGMQAHDTLPEGLQGRLTAMIKARIGGDVIGTRDGCLGILRTDPWAAEACSTLWAMAFPDDATAQEAVDAARATILGEIAKLEDRWVSDPVVANELIKFRARIKDRDGRNAYRERVEKQTRGFRYLNRTRWWRSGTVIAPPYRSMNVATTKTRDLPPAERLASLLGHWESVPAEGADDWGLTRYLRAVAETAAATGDRKTQEQALEALVRGLPDDPDALLSIARFRAEDEATHEEAVRLVRLSADKLIAQPWDPMASASRRKRFTDHVAALKSGLAVRRELESTLAEPTIDPTVVPSKPSEWFAWADAATDPVLALHGSLEAVSLVAVADRERLPDSVLAPTLERFNAAMPAIEALGLDARAALFAAAAARARDRDRRVETGGKEQHPLVGQAAPAFSLDTLSGASLTNENQLGSVVVVDFWATWCGPCIKEMPHLQELKASLGDAPVTFLLASVDGTEDVVAPFMKQRAFDFDPAWVGETGMKQRWQVRGIPSLFVVDRSGIVRHHHQGYRPDIGGVLEGQIKSLLADP